MQKPWRIQTKQILKIMFDIDMEDIVVDGDNGAHDEGYHLDNNGTDQIDAENLQDSTEMSINKTNVLLTENKRDNVSTKSLELKKEVPENDLNISSTSRDNLEINKPNVKHPNNKTGMYNCADCEYSSKGNFLVRRHWDQIHNPDPDFFKCVQCEFTSKDKYHIKKHIQAKHTGLKYDCDECEFQTSYAKDVKRHTMRKHNYGVKPYQCDQCQYKTYTKYYLPKHMKTMHK